jgi:hypothetical protein
MQILESEPIAALKSRQGAAAAADAVIHSDAPGTSNYASCYRLEILRR